jgi:N-acetylglucosamine kinase-like BadF-type ATPase
LSTRAVIGIDAGGTKTVGILVTETGAVVASSRQGCGNYHTVGLEEAEQLYAAVLKPLLARAEAENFSVQAVSYGLSGLDRPQDEARLLPIARTLTPKDAEFDLVNDTYLILRAGTVDGTGVAVVSGTGCNAVGQSSDQQRARIGGLGPDFGDDGCANTVGTAAMRAAFRMEDGRGAFTLLNAAIKARYDLDQLDALVDYCIADAERPMKPSDLAPLVFQASYEGDEVATDILRKAGQSLAHSAAVVGKKLFTEQASFPLVMGGALLQRGKVPVMRDALVAGMRQCFPQMEAVCLSSPPILGAALLGLDCLARRLSNPEWPDASLITCLKEALREEA